MTVQREDRGRREETDEEMNVQARGAALPRLVEVKRWRKKKRGPKAERRGTVAAQRTVAARRR